MTQREIRIGGASGFWGDSGVATAQLVRRAEIDYLMYDYLAELTMAILAKMRAKDSTLGYATDFVTVAMRHSLKEIAEKGVRVVSNAGGMNPAACGAALEALADELGVSVKVAVVEGDDITGDLDALMDAGRLRGESGRPSQRYASANAYLGAGPVKAALDRGADIVITGRCADSALALGALMHEFDWAPDDFDRLAAGSLAGHILECGAQATGGLHTDWERVERWEDIGYPIATCREDGSFRVSKPEGAGGLIDPAAIAEQMLYEIGDPAAYRLPDVICDFTAVRIAEDGPDHVRVDGARGYAPGPEYKVSATFMEGYRAIATLTIIGADAAAKAERTAAAIVKRVQGMLRAFNMGDFTHVDVEAIGAEAIYGPHSRARGAREVVLKLAVRHPDKRALEVFAREIAPAGTSFAPGTTGITAGRPKPQPVVRLESLYVAKDALSPVVRLGGETVSAPAPTTDGPGDRPDPVKAVAPSAAPDGPVARVPLIRLAWARSGDKGDSANIGVIARRPDYLPQIKRALTPEAVAAYFAHLVKGPVERFDVPGVHAVNFLMHQALDGGGMTSLRNDPLGKGLAQMLLDFELDVPAALIADNDP